MCNINILLRKDTEIEQQNILSFIQSVTSHSYTTNNDGEGFYADNSKRVVKSLNKINYFQYKEILEKSKVIITHQRQATSGFHFKYTQPLASKEFVIVHNGIMSDFAFNQHSDTYNFFQLFLKRFEKKQKGNREKQIIKAIKSILNKAEFYCSYSIALFDKITGNLYYFKNKYTKINLFMGRGMIYITTSEENKNLLELFKMEKFQKLEIQDYVIYRIDANLKIMPVCEIERDERKEVEKNLWYYFDRF